MIIRKNRQLHNTTGSYMYILQLHLIPIQALVSHLKIATVDNSLISSLGVFHDKTPLNESNSMPGLLFPFLTGNLQGSLC